MNADRINELYAGQIFSLETQKLCRERVHWMCRQVRGDKVLDIGCSQGIVSLLLGREGFDCTGIDYEKNSIDFARTELEKEEETVRKRVRFELVDATTLPFEAETFDTVMLGEILEHLTNPGRVLKEARRVLKKEGTAVITVPFGLNNAPDHKMTYYPASFLELVRPYFEPVKIDTIEANILFVGRKPASDDPASISPELAFRDLFHLQRDMERRCLLKEQMLLERSVEFYEKSKKLNEAVEANKKATEEVRQLLNLKTRELEEVLSKDEKEIAAVRARESAAVEKWEQEKAGFRKELEERLGEEQKRHQEELSARDREVASIIEAKDVLLQQAESGRLREIEDLRYALAAKRETREELERRLAAIVEELTSHQGKSAELEKLKEERESALSQRESEIIRLRGALESANNAVTLHQEILAGQEKRAAELQSSVASLQLLLAESEGQNSEITSRLTKLSEMFDEQGALLSAREKDLESLRLNNALDLRNKERYFRMAMTGKEKEHEKVLLKKIKDFEVTLNAIEKRFQDDLKRKDAALNDLSSSYAKQLEEMQISHKHAVVELKEEWEVRLLEQGIEHRQEVARKSAEVTEFAESHAREIAEIREEWEVRLNQQGIEHRQEIARKSAEITELTERHTRELAEGEAAFNEKFLKLENEWQTRFAKKNEELKTKLEEMRREKECALVDQEELFRRAYSWRLGSVLTGGVVLAADMIKQPHRASHHFRKYIRNVIPAPAQPAGEPPRRELPLKPSEAPGPAAAPESLAVRPLDLPAIRKDRVTLGCILDEFTAENFRPECRMVTFRPDNWKQVLEANPPNAIFVESAWRGNDGAWLYRIAKYPANMGDELQHLLEWAKAQGIPSFFWNKEDPVHFDRFIPKAKNYDYIFTSDADCIPRYREALGHDRVFSLPFAAQPRIQNPVLEENRQNLACFAGTYYGDTMFPERQRDMEYLLRPALDFGLHIYDRQYGMVGPEADKYRFPDIYQPAIQGRLDFTEMVKAYKNYRVFLNVNSVKDSPTMFSRRVFELLASGTPVISTYSKGIQEMFGSDLVLLTESEADTRTHLEKLFNDEDYWARLSVRGMRHVMEGHTYAQRMSYVLTCMGMNHTADDDVYFTALARIDSQRDLDNLLGSLGSQNYRKFEVKLLCSDKVKKGQIQKFVEAMVPVRVATIPHGNENALEQAISHATTDFVCVFDPADHYGANYLKDYAIALRYANALYIGKETHFTEESNIVELRNPGNEFRYSFEVPVATLAIKRNIIDLKYLHKLLTNRTFRNKDRKILSLDRFNYLHNTNREIPADSYAKTVDL